MGDSDEDPETIYELVQSVGEGSYGAVWKGVHRQTAAACAIKIIPIDDDISELKKEIAILKKCQSEFVVTYFGSYIKDKHVWIVMELCEAGSVNDLMHICDVHFDEQVIRTICASVILGLSYLHGQNIIHRDIKAGNVLLTKSGQAKLADFGVSAQLSTMHAKRKTVIGTPFWMAPEVIQESQYDGKADIWSLGITLIELAEFEPPYSNIHPMRAIFMIPSRPPPKFHEPAKWSTQMNDFLAKCLTKNPEQRPSANDLMVHPFAQQVVHELDVSKPVRGVSPLLKDLVDKYTPRINEFRQEETNRAALQANNNNTTALRGNTVIYEQTRAGGEAPKSSVNPAFASGTLLSTGTVVLDGTALRVPTNGGSIVRGGDTIRTNVTMANNGKDAPQPSFMSYFMTSKDKAAAGHGTFQPPAAGKAPLTTAGAGPASGGAEADRSAAMTMEEVQRIRARIRMLDVQFRNDFKELKRQYDKRKKYVSFSPVSVYDTSYVYLVH
jgi:serine/threonine kinase 3